MIVDLQILKALLNKEAYNKYEHWIKYDDLYKKHYALLRSTHETIEGDIALNDYLVLAQQQGLQYLEELREIEVGHEALQELIKTHSERSWAYGLGLVCMEVFEGRRNVSDVFEEYSKIESLKDKTETDYKLDINKIIEETNREGGIKWRLPFLNEKIGGLRGGDSGFVFARTNMGKTTFNADQFSYFLEQLERPGLWCNNEEGGSRIITRLLQASLEITYDELKEAPDYYQEKFIEKTNNSFRFFDKGMMHRKDIEAKIRELHPQIVIIDNIDKIKGFTADRRDVQLGQIYIWQRELAKEYDCAIIGVCQASANAENKKWLTHDDIAEAKTAKSSEADFIIGIGGTYDIGSEDIRYIRLVKNKFLHGEHRVQCRIHPEIARYTEL